ncbi:MAG: type III-B CRISPR-associated protein Cas10/Cmr2 [Pseudanabaenaceae cyanobacterium]
MSSYWQAKIWGLLHDPVLKALHANYGRGGTSFWSDLTVMQNWKDPHASGGTLSQHILSADYITSASDRAAIGSLSVSWDYDAQGLAISHLLSGAKQSWQLPDRAHQEVISQGPQKRSVHLSTVERSLFPDAIKNSTDPRLVFWWLWRCLPEVVAERFDDPAMALMPAETRIPDGSIWSHLSLTAALAGALAGYDLNPAEIERWPQGKSLSRPCLASFTFSPVQERIKASRKTRDFWAGSWLLHYLSAKVCWALAWKYGPDTLIYPSLYAQPLVDYWLLHGLANGNSDFGGWGKHPEFHRWVKTPDSRTLLTAGFPNVIVLVLPQGKVKAAMQMAKQTLLAEWEHLGDRTFAAIRAQDPQWMPGLQPDGDTWGPWLKAQWQTYWSGYPLGDPQQELRSSDLYKTADNRRDEWTEAQNQFCLLSDKDAMFLEEERQFLVKAGELRKQKQHRNPFNANVGSWWAHAFDRLRQNLAATKNARSWELPTAFGVRSTVSGLGSALHAHRWHEHPNGKDPDAQVSLETSIKEQWQRRAGLFDGREMLNATETLKRALHKILPDLFPEILANDRPAVAYPDLTAGVAGYLQTQKSAIAHFRLACQTILETFPETKDIVAEMGGKWGIPWADGRCTLRDCHPRLLSPGWLLEDLCDPQDENRPQLRKDLEQAIAQFYPGNNPTHWYVIAAGDGDSMSKWLKGDLLGHYRDYVPERFVAKVQEQAQQGTSQLQEEVAKCFARFLNQKKRMGPSTHAALSRALLDFSNQLLPYLTEQRYAGRLIYGGGDDVLAYTNLWQWDTWLWDIRQCFRGAEDPKGEFAHSGDYWQWQDRSRVPENFPKRPLFTMGSKATISFGIVIAHHSVPLAIALEHMWEAEAEAKEHKHVDSTGNKKVKDAVQVRVIYGNGNVLKATGKFDAFHPWRSLPEIPDVEPALFEQAATLWEQHPAPVYTAIEPWCAAFCDRREKLTQENKPEFSEKLKAFLQALWNTTQETERDREIENWLKLAAFVRRKRKIQMETMAQNPGTNNP